MPGTAPCPFMKRLIRASGSRCFSAQIPASPGVIRPSGETAVASAITSPAPPTAREPRWTKCQSVATPSAEEYWHIGETPMRLRNVMDLIVHGEKRSGCSLEDVAIRALKYAVRNELPSEHALRIAVT